MALYILSYSSQFMIGNGNTQVFCPMESDIVKSLSYGFPNIDIPLIFELHKKAKLTNCLSQGAIASGGFLVDEKVRDLLADFTLIAHKYYPTEIIGKKGEIIGNYKWLQIEEVLTEEIDYDKSVFYETNGISIIGERKIDSFQWYEEQKVEKGWRFGMNAKSVVLKRDSRLSKVDLFRLFPFDHEIIISERLKNAIEKSGITGFEIEEYSKIRLVDENATKSR